MIYRYERSSDNMPNMKMKFTGITKDSFVPQDNWRFYNNTFTISPVSPSNFIFNIELAA